MKSLRNVVRTVTFILSITICSVAQAQTVTLSGKVFNKENTIDKAVFHIYMAGALIDSTLTTRSGKFKIKLAENNNYEIRISKDGFVEKTININMQKEKSKDAIPSFQFDVDLYKAYEFRYVGNHDEMPLAAYIYYNEALGLLDWDRSITAQAKNEIAELRKVNKENRRSKFKSF